MALIDSGSDSCFATMRAAAEFGMALRIKNTFLEFNDEDCSGFRKMKTTRSRSQPVGRTSSAFDFTAIDVTISPPASIADVGPREDVADPAPPQVITHDMAQGNAASKSPTSRGQEISKEGCYTKPSKSILAPKPATLAKHEEWSVYPSDGKHGNSKLAKRKQRPCKGQRTRYRKQASLLEEWVALAPEMFDPDSLDLPPSIENNLHVKQKLIARLMLLKNDLLSMKASDAEEQWHSYK